MITVFSNNKEIPVNKVTFSDGAITYKLDQLPAEPDYICVTVDPSTPVKDVREEVNMIISCMENFYGEDYLYSEGSKIELYLPYLCYGRADRVFEKGNPSPLYDFLEWLDINYFKEIRVCDIHNSKILDEYTTLSEELLPIKEKTQLQCFKDSLSYDTVKDWDVVVAPDKGAVEKSKTIAEYLGVPCVFANKVRDISTGKLTEMTLPEYDFTGKKVLIPDDICDKAGTHLWLASKLKNVGAEHVTLYATHLILPERFEKFGNEIDKILFHHCVGGYVNREDVMRFNNGK